MVQFLPALFLLIFNAHFGADQALLPASLFRGGVQLNRALGESPAAQVLAAKRFAAESPAAQAAVEPSSNQANLFAGVEDAADAVFVDSCRSRDGPAR